MIGWKPWGRDGRRRSAWHPHLRSRWGPSPSQMSSPTPLSISGSHFHFLATCPPRKLFLDQEYSKAISPLVTSDVYIACTFPVIPQEPAPCHLVSSRNPSLPLKKINQLMAPFQFSHAAMVPFTKQILHFGIALQSSISWLQFLHPRK